jgi:hypothetical protein
MKLSFHGIPKAGDFSFEEECSTWFSVGVSTITGRHIFTCF